MASIGNNSLTTQYAEINKVYRVESHYRACFCLTITINNFCLIIRPAKLGTDDKLEFITYCPKNRCDFRTRLCAVDFIMIYWR